MSYRTMIVVSYDREMADKIARERPALPPCRVGTMLDAGDGPLSITFRPETGEFHVHGKECDIKLDAVKAFTVAANEI